jgi:hypothetical protein
LGFIKQAATDINRKLFNILSPSTDFLIQFCFNEVPINMLGGNKNLKQKQKKFAICADE